MQQHTPEEFAFRQGIVQKAVAEAIAYLVQEGTALTPEQGAEATARLEAIVDVFIRDEPLENLDLLTCAATFQIIGELTDTLPPGDPQEWALQLGAIAAMETAELMRLGGYPAPSHTQFKMISKFLRRRALAIVARGYAQNPERAREEMREAARLAVVIGLGEAPNRAKLN